MELIRGLHNLRDKHRGCVATIGNFDGVHLGHRKVIAQVKQRAAELQLPAVAVVFEPQPREYFAGDQAPPRLTRFGEKMRLLAAEGIDRVVCLSFNARLQSMTAEAFIDELLLRGLAVRHFVVGDDFRFGCDRMGDYPLLERAGETYGFTVVNTETFLVEAERVSSTRIRSLLSNNQLDEAEQLLGRRYAIHGRVLHGQKLGRQLGAPTANVRMHRFASPMRGVYCAWLRVAGSEKRWPAVCNIGVRPTVSGAKHPVLEAHILDFDGDLYGRLVSVEFASFVRAEQRFDGLASLQQQILHDIEQARCYFASVSETFRTSHD